MDKEIYDLISKDDRIDNLKNKNILLKKDIDSIYNRIGMINFQLYVLNENVINYGGEIYEGLIDNVIPFYYDKNDPKYSKEERIRGLEGILNLNTELINSNYKCIGMNKIEIEKLNKGD